MTGEYQLPSVRKLSISHPSGSGAQAQQNLGRMSSASRKEITLMESMEEVDVGIPKRRSDVVEFDEVEEPQIVSGRRAKALRDKRKKLKPGSFGKKYGAIWDRVRSPCMHYFLY